MLPGIILPPGGIDSLECFETNTLCSVSLIGNSAPVAVGLTSVSRSGMSENGMKGKGVYIQHVFTDFLWAHGSKTLLPQIDESGIDEHPTDSEKSHDVPRDGPHESSIHQEQESTADENCEARNRDSNNDDKSSQNMGIVESQQPSDEACAGATIQQALSCDELQPANLASFSSPSEMDELLEHCFFCAVLRLKECDIPILTRTFFRNNMLPFCADGQSLDLKKSSYKKLSKFLQTMQEKGLIKVEEISKGVHSVTAVDYSHDDLKLFKTTIKTMPKKQEIALEKQPSLSIEEMVSVSGSVLRLFADVGYTKGSVLSMTDTRKIVTEYIKKHELVDTSNKRMVFLDPIITNAVVNKNENISTLSWESLFTRVINKMNNCYKIDIPGKPTTLRKGKVNPLEIKIEQRMGNKKVTLVRHLELYGIDPQEFAHKIQVKAACSTSVCQLPGKQGNPGMQVLVQGNQINIVATALIDEYNIPKKYISGLEHLKKAKKEMK